MTKKSSRMAIGKATSTSHLDEDTAMPADRSNVPLAAHFEAAFISCARARFDEDSATPGAISSRRLVCLDRHHPHPLPSLAPHLPRADRHRSAHHRGALRLPQGATLELNRARPAPFGQV